jgi:hypothetical protein
MTRERFREMLRVLSDGDAIEITSCVSSDQWIHVAIDDNEGHFNICVDNKWYPAPIGGPGCVEWRHIGEYVTGPITA